MAGDLSSLPAHHRDAILIYEEAFRATNAQIAARFSQLTPEDRLQCMVSAIERALEVESVAITTASNAGAGVKRTGSKKKPVRAYIDGCFDIMHSGHYNAIRQAKALTDILVVGVHSDAEITRSKGPPVMNNEERLAMVKACKWVDEVVFDTPYNPSLELLDKHNCDFCVHGDDTAVSADGTDAYEEVRNAGRLRIIQRTAGVSTTNLVGRLLLMTKEHLQEAKQHSLQRSSLSPPLTPQMPGVTLTSNLPRLALDKDTSPRGPAASGRRSVSPNPLKPAEKSASADAVSPKPFIALDAPPMTESKTSAAAANSGKTHDGAVNNFLPTTWRISQFSNGTAPKPTDKVVYIDGAFDLFHVGHCEALEEAKKLGDFLYVGVHDDNTVNAHKGKNYPIMNLHERVMNVLSCKWVDEVVIGAPWVVTEDLMKVLNISIVASGGNTKMDFEVESVDKESVDPYKIAKEKGMLRMLPTQRALTTDEVVDRIIQNRQKYLARNAPREKKDLAYLAQRQYVPEV